MLQIRPHLRHCNACRATVRELHVSRLRRASLFSPIFALTSLKHEIAALFHRAQASDLATGTGLATAGGGGRVATVGAVLGLCLGGAGVGTVCVVNGGLPDVGGDKPALVRATHDREPRKERPREAPPARREPPVVTKPALSSTSHDRAPLRSPRPPRRAHVAARPRRKQPPASSASRTKRPLPARRSHLQPPQSQQPPPAPTQTASKTFSPAEQEFLP